MGTDPEVAIDSGPEGQWAIQLPLTVPAIKQCASLARTMSPAHATQAVRRQAGLLTD